MVFIARNKAFFESRFFSLITTSPKFCQLTEFIKKLKLSILTAIS